MSAKKTDSLFYKTLITDAWTSDIVLLFMIGIALSLLVCIFLSTYLPFTLFLLSLGITTGFAGATALVIAQKWPAIHVYRSGNEYQVEKVRDKLGARVTSQRETDKLRPILERIAQQEPRARGFNKIFILDMPAVGIFTIGNSIFTTAQTLESPYMGALLAHEIGHIQNEDGTVMLALRMFFQLNLLSRDSLSNPLEFSTGTLIGETVDYGEWMQSLNPVGLIKDTKVSLVVLLIRNLVGGSGFGVRVHMKAWSTYFREQDFLADAFAVKCGYGRQLANYLEEYKHVYSSDQLAWQSAPELRIDRILAAR